MLKWTTETKSGKVCSQLYVHSINIGVATPADIIACLKANPESCAEVMRALAPLTMANANADHDRAEQAERELAQEKQERARDIDAMLRAETQLKQAERERDEAMAEISGAMRAYEIEGDESLFDMVRRIASAAVSRTTEVATERAAREKAESRASAAEAKLAALSALIHTESGLDDHRYSPEQMVTEMALLWQGASDDCEAAERVVEAAVRWRNARAACLGIRDAADALASATWVWEAHKTSAGSGAATPEGGHAAPTDSPVGVAATAEPAGEWQGSGGSKHRCSVCGCYWRLNDPTDAQPDGSWSLWDGRQKPGQCCDNVRMGEQIKPGLPLTRADLDALEARIVERVARACVQAEDHDWSVGRDGIARRIANELRRKP